MTLTQWWDPATRHSKPSQAIGPTFSCPRPQGAAGAAGDRRLARGLYLRAAPGGFSQPHRGDWSVLGVAESAARGPHSARRQRISRWRMNVRLVQYPAW
jgi:hypothetical protein